MNNPSELRVQADEVGVRLKFTIKRNGAAMNLTDSEVKLCIEGFEPQACQIIDPTNGRADYLTTTGIWDPGLYPAQILVTYSGGSVFRSQVFDLRVDEPVFTPEPEE